MAEYLNIKTAQKYLLTYQDDGHTYEPSYFASALDKLPPADVIERSKINKAIKEIEDLTFYWIEMNPQTVKEQILEILKRHIGE